MEFLPYSITDSAASKGLQDLEVVINAGQYDWSGFISALLKHTEQTQPIGPWQLQIQKEQIIHTTRRGPPEILCMIEFVDRVDRTGAA